MMYPPTSGKKFRSLYCGVVGIYDKSLNKKSGIIFTVYNIFETIRYKLQVFGWDMGNWFRHLTFISTSRERNKDGF
jgi:hypothetical protein